MNRGKGVLKAKKGKKSTAKKTKTQKNTSIPVNLEFDNLMDTITHNINTFENTHQSIFDSWIEFKDITNTSPQITMRSEAKDVRKSTEVEDEVLSIS